MIDEVKKLVKEKKVVIGTNEILKNLKLGKIKKVYQSSNCPIEVKNDINYYAQLHETEVVELQIPNDELGALCRKPFLISVLGVKKE